MIIFGEWCENVGIPENLSLSGEIVRFNYRGEMDGWFLGFRSGEKVSALCGSWKTGERHEFKESSFQSEEERQTYEREFRETQERAERGREARAREAASDALRIWEGASPIGDSAYLQAKGLKAGLYGFRLGASGELIVPIQGKSGALVGIQRIFQGGEKKILYGTPMSGAYAVCPVGGLGEPRRVFVCEGIATALSVYEATGELCVAAFTCHNLTAVTSMLRDRGFTVVVCADDDHNTEKKLGKNPGKDRANACRVLGASVVFPKWEKERGNASDFNDLMTMEGIHKVKECIEEGLRESKSIVPLTPLREGYKTPADMDVVDHFLQWSESKDERLCYSHGDWFRWTGTHWKWLTESEESQLKVVLTQMYGRSVTGGKIESIVKLLTIKLGSMYIGSEGLHNPPIGKVNFLNGTLHVAKGKLSLAEHNPGDFLTHLLPFEWRDDPCEEGEFSRYLARILPLKEDRDMLSEAYGAALVPVYPVAYFLYGQSFSGKSTVLNILRMLLPESYVSSVDPQEFSGFGLENMVGKLVNICDDIKYDRGGLPDDNLKKLLSGSPANIQRKFKKSVVSRLPTVHIFTANKLPVTGEESDAYFRRFRFIQFGTKVVGGGLDRGGDHFYPERLLEGCKEEIVAFAIKGALKLAASHGDYALGADHKIKLQGMLKMNELPQLVADELASGDHDLVFDPEGRIDRNQLRTFVDAITRKTITKPHLDRIVTFLCSNYGCMRGKSNGDRLIKGIGARSK